MKINFSDERNTLTRIAEQSHNFHNASQWRRLVTTLLSVLDKLQQYDTTTTVNNHQDCPSGLVHRRMYDQAMKDLIKAHNAIEEQESKLRGIINEQAEELKGLRDEVEVLRGAVDRNHSSEVLSSSRSNPETLPQLRNPISFP